MSSLLALNRYRGMLLRVVEWLSTRRCVKSTGTGPSKCHRPSKCHFQFFEVFCSFLVSFVLGKVIPTQSFSFIQVARLFFPITSCKKKILQIFIFCETAFFLKKLIPQITEQSSVGPSNTFWKGSLSATCHTRKNIYNARTDIYQSPKTRSSKKTL